MEIYSEDYLNGDQFYLIERQKENMKNLRKRTLELYKHATDERDADLLQKMDKIMKRGEYLVDYLTDFKNNQFQQLFYNEHNGKDVHLKLLKEILEPINDQAMAFYSNSLDEVYQKRIVSKPKDFKSSNFNFDIVLPFYNDKYNENEKCISIDSLPMFYKTKGL